MYHIENAEALADACIALRFRDGFEGQVSIEHLIASGGVFAFLADADRFKQLHIGEDGRWLYWEDPAGGEVDLCADALRFEAETVAVDALTAAE
jgi:hypothetical protein